MIDNNQITALAREYVEKVYDGDTDFIEGAELVIRFLLRRYCLVEKSKVDNIYKGILVQQDPKNFGYSAYNQGRKELLESLFPEIAKAVEE